VAAFTEAMDLLSDQFRAQEALWEMVTRGVVQILPLDATDVPESGS